METTSVKFKSIDDYIAVFPPGIKKQLAAMRKAIKQAAPKATEVISYNMPAFRQHKVLVYFAGYKGHIGFYPTASGIAQFKQELSGYKNSKGAVQFPLDEPIPVELVKRMVAFRVAEDLDKVKMKKK